MASRATTLHPELTNSTAAGTSELKGSAQPIAVQNTPGSDIAALAYRLWEERGCPLGSPEEDWFAAERQLKSQ